MNLCAYEFLNELKKFYIISLYEFKYKSMWHFDTNFYKFLNEFMY